MIIDNMKNLNGKSIMQIASRHISKTTTMKEFAGKFNAMREERTVLHKVISRAEVDGEPWLTVKCNLEVSKWLRKQKNSSREHIDQQWNAYLDTFDISEELYMMLVLKFGK
jgi:hypothetical protein